MEAIVVSWLLMSTKISYFGMLLAAQRLSANVFKIMCKIEISFCSPFKINNLLFKENFLTDSQRNWAIIFIWLHYILFEKSREFVVFYSLALSHTLWFRWNTLFNRYSLTVICIISRTGSTGRKREVDANAHTLSHTQSHNRWMLNSAIAKQQRPFNWERYVRSNRSIVMLSVCMRLCEYKAEIFCILFWYCGLRRLRDSDRDAES